MNIDRPAASGLTRTSPPRAATHSGTMHSDDMLAAALLAVAYPGVAITRTRDRKVLADQDIVFDVGEVFDPATARFDHHQPGAPVKADGTPYSSAGLVWRHCEPRLRSRFPAGRLELFRSEVVDGVDYADNGLLDPQQRPGSRIARPLSSINHNWDEPADDEDARFAAGAEMLEDFFLGVMAGATPERALRFLKLKLSPYVAKSVAATGRAQSHLATALACRAPGYPLLVLDRPLPWREIVEPSEHPEIAYVVMPRNDGDWLVQSMPTSDGAFGVSHPFPESWRGLTDARLERASGVPGAAFCHLKAFCAVARNKEAALRLAGESLAQHRQRRFAELDQPCLEAMKSAVGEELTVAV